LEIAVKVGGTAGTVKSRKRIYTSVPSRNFVSQKNIIDLSGTGGFFMAIYTRTGDRGKTRLGTGKQISKDSLRVESYGTVDELNALLGVVISDLPSRKKHTKQLKEFLTIIQSDLLCLGAYLANPKMLDMISHFEKRVKKFEQEIDFMMKKTPPLTSFILPQGGRVGSLLQLSRTVSRRAERRIVSLSKKENVDSKVLVYINRISDLFLAMARFSDFGEGKKEIIWSRDKYIK
jgi:cob(I)alamin adenosyltransferase